MARPAGQGNKTKLKIIQSATELFRQKGYGASIEDLRLKTGISKGLMYYHFKNKEELFIACLKNETMNLISNWTQDQSNARLTATEKLYLVTDYFIEGNQNSLIYNIPQFVAQSELDETNKNLNLEQLTHQIIAPEINLIHEILEEGVQKGEFSPALNKFEVSMIMYSCISSFLLMREVGLYSDLTASLHRSFLDLILPGLANKPQGGS
ncbi:TetR/AcrR family transcriptional regulator [Paenibacillus daejeonensis]|uniref:TetR/AcrR family transcriptional regulator n=1 Tax=Paenibacillus daejeonensis TaxID=135193 RepID=UPI00035EC7E9|nr:TetR/AcrR family transcriptional regulator [Paenibacillus daejeonensis]